ncbi:hypothetical protein [Nisaea nitritireducens]|uniref:hypothetical protein n=1 Tax=Nisaea nitritireducens TaxID=568392 RepID=UPI001868338C|nr:hypothetical protein [Nisaea nitritireducens]
MPLFAPHGEYSLELDGNIIKNSALGAANQETIEDYVKELALLIGQFSGAPFAIYSDYDPAVILTHDAVARLKESIAERCRHGMCAAALNLSRSSHRLITSAQIGGLYEEAGVPWREFDSYEAAKPWLEARIEEARKASGQN